eukprot:scaffold27148_cov50-Attheya_sp.AAC.1
MTYHHNMCSKANCSDCNPEIPARRTACLGDNLLFKQCAEEGGAKECQKKWAEIATVLQCKLCEVTVQNQRVSLQQKQKETEQESVVHKTPPQTS